VTSFGIGAPVRRREDNRLLTGQGRYADDVNARGQAYAAFVRSPHAHADVVAIDAAPARGVAGVLDVFTGRDLVADGVGTIPTLIAERGGGIRSRDGSPFAEPPWYPLATDRVRHVGEPIAIVVAPTPASAQDGAHAVNVDYAARPLVVDAVAALAEGAPSLHDGVARNRGYDWECGDAAATARAIAAAAHVTRLTLLDNRLVTCFVEPRAALAEWDAVAERYTLRASLQTGEAILVANLDENLDWRETPLLSAMRAKSLICLPIKIDKKTIAAMMAVSPEPLPEFTAEDLQVYHQVARQTSVILQNISLLNETRRRLQEVNLLLDFSRQLRGMDTERIFRALLDSARRALYAAHAGMVLVWDEHTGHLMPQAVSGYAANETMKRISYNPGEYLPGKVFETKRPIRVDEVQEIQAALLLCFEAVLCDVGRSDRRMRNGACGATGAIRSVNLGRFCLTT
jgi:hypothetical protein